MVNAPLLMKHVDKFQEVMSSVTAAAPTGAYSGKYVDATTRYNFALANKSLGLLSCSVLVSCKSLNYPSTYTSD
jgi:hypothetical protein